ncbi:hypothetical protein UAY_01438 [Enterococcus moraviensis ATCC BAA-383]|uniref:DUF2812 domain-containing protein n=1 Tax=Enterococcus moraviensis ATCC BAA-383 TaxID=1158609 RepID=R2QV01_9ENTE|nr:DUF2812 domain-containing protein [Enterococcus moraviensis]EOI00335.1 hypothetical protein UAY_01438 [Enterococcus moraviensis ATCC BAA-383]EOT73436.1 hypothetical protein I586_00429 [Enterococcus moraviensis ATCC BAA-383]
MKMFRGKKYIYSRGIAFYPEKEMQLLKKLANKGWHFKRMNQVGFLVFEKGMPEDKEFSVDFFDGSSNELSEYLVIYKQAGWENVANYKKKYFYFKADRGTPTIYSDPESYWIRMKKEWIWLLIRSFIYLPLGIGLLTFIALTKDTSNTILATSGIRIILIISAMVFTALPIGVAICVIFSLVMYNDRTNYYNRPEYFAKRQRIVRDSILLAVIGFIIGLLFSIILKDSL